MASKPIHDYYTQNIMASEDSISHVKPYTVEWRDVLWPQEGDNPNKDFEKILIELTCDKRKKKRKRDKKIIRVNDFVKITSPYRFLKCGYYTNYKTVKHDLARGENLKKIEALMTELGMQPETYKTEKLVTALARLKADRPWREGARRTVFERVIPIRNLSSYIFTVEGIRYCKTGVYREGYMGGDPYWGYVDYEPSFLDRQKTHKILTLGPTPEIPMPKHRGFTRFEVLASRVEKVHVNELPEEEAKTERDFEKEVRKYIEEYPVDWGRQINDRITVSRVQTAWDYFSRGIEEEKRY